MLDVAFQFTCNRLLIIFLQGNIFLFVCEKKCIMIMYIYLATHWICLFSTYLYAYTKWFKMAKSSMYVTFPYKLSFVSELLRQCSWHFVCHLIQFHYLHRYNIALENENWNVKYERNAMHLDKEKMKNLILISANVVEMLLNLIKMLLLWSLLHLNVFGIRNISYLSIW